MMAIRGTGATPGSENPTRLSEALQGRPVRQAPQQQAGQPVQGTGGNDRVTLSEQIRVTMRTANEDMQRVQERIVMGRQAADALEGIRDQVVNLRSALQQNIAQPERIDAISQTINTINRLAENTRFQGNPVLTDVNAETLGVANAAPGATPPAEYDRVLERAQTQVENRLNETRQENAVDRRRMETLQVTLENVAAVTPREQPEEPQNVERAVESIRREGMRGGRGEIDLTPDRVLELI
jgi:hypothetical protein